ncbi:hypothetical protein SNOUR_42530 [Streptomyces noursei ATCC 11455]|nr:hypothetical protein SNOUR_00925 [Streptomyces noursei ATCC 11455]ANZ21712.1 hypothetical protein SNOUR_42435 [Streptomyces noursei ATCC 11455]ANZ21731.1 hypothetical protein SNOUR_42530 [Streptomyces noursei ATCC 11455]
MGAWVAGGEPGADCRIEGVAVNALQDSAHGGLGRGGRAGGFAGWAAEHGEHGGRCVGRPFSDRRQRFRAGQHRTRGERKDEAEGMTAALGPARIGHRHEAAQQMRVFPRVGGASAGELAQADWDER